MVNIWFVCINIWLIYGLYVVYTWLIYGQYMANIWFIDG